MMLSVSFVLDRKSTRLNSSHTEIYALSLHDALPISALHDDALLAATQNLQPPVAVKEHTWLDDVGRFFRVRSEEHTSELQSHRDLRSFPTRRSSDLSFA